MLVRLGERWVSLLIGSNEAPIISHRNRRTRQVGGGGGASLVTPKEIQANAGKINKIQANISENILNSGYFITLQIRANCLSAPRKGPARRLMHYINVPKYKSTVKNCTCQAVFWLPLALARKAKP